jgi:hypothetical protein
MLKPTNTKKQEQTEQPEQLHGRQLPQGEQQLTREQRRQLRRPLKPVNQQQGWRKHQQTERQHQREAVGNRLKQRQCQPWKGSEKAYQQRQRQGGLNKGGEPPKEKAVLEGGGTTCQP